MICSSARLCSVGLLLFTVAVPAAAQDAETAKTADDGQQPEITVRNLRDGQTSVSGRFERFERMLQQMADLIGRDDPERAELLRRAIGQGREERVSERIEGIIGLLSNEEFGTAVEQQTEVVDSLQELLTLLQSEDRRNALEAETERLNGVLRDVRQIIADQNSARAATRNAVAPSGAAREQQRPMDRAERLLNDIKDHDRRNAEAAEGDADNTEEGDPASEQDPAESGESSPNGDEGGDPKEGDPKESEGGDPTESGDPSESEPSSESQSGESGSESQQSSGSQSGQPNQTAGREQLEKAQQRMKEAMENLKKQEREGALEKQKEALEELRKAEQELEELLRQLRDEEKELILSDLTARFQQMLAVETQIHVATKELAEIEKDKWLDRYYSRCRELASEQRDLAQLALQTTNLIREDGTVVAVLVAVEDITVDMQFIHRHLEEINVGGLTQAMQEDVLEALRELIEALQKEMQEMSEEQQQQQQQDGPQDNQALVDRIAEIRMLRSLQQRINRRTRRVDLMFDEESESEETLNEQLSELTSRQRKLFESAKELAKAEETGP